MRETVMPNPRCADKIGVFSEGRRHDLAFLRRDEAAALPHYSPGSIQQQVRALHEASSENNRVRSE
jgi:uncharacterized protein YqeY